MIEGGDASGRSATEPQDTAWRAFIRSPWRIGVFLAWAIALFWVVLSSSFSTELISLLNDMGCGRWPGTLINAIAFVLCVMTGFAAATIDYTRAREHRFLAMTNLALAAGLCLLPSLVSMGLVSIIDVALGVAAAPVNILMRGGDDHGVMQASWDPMPATARGEVFWDCTTGWIAAGEPREEALAFAVQAAAWRLAQGDPRGAIEDCGRIRACYSDDTMTDAIRQQIFEINTLAKHLAGENNTYSLSSRLQDLAVEDARRALLRAWLLADAGDTTAASKVLANKFLWTGPHPWKMRPDLAYAPRAWAEALRDLLPADRVRIDELAKWAEPAP